MSLDIATVVASEVPVLLGPCIRQDDYGPYCVVHDSGWREEGTCHYVNEHTEFAQRLIAQWETRNGR